MIIGIPKEIKNNEYRVASIPNDVKTIVEKGNKVLIESGAGVGSGFYDIDYESVGAEIVNKEYLFRKSDLIYKVKEFQKNEFKYFREDLIIFTYIHSNAHIEQTQEMLDSKIIGIAYEDITDKNGNFPLLKPMSEFAGMGGFIAALNYTQSINGGSGILLADINGIKRANITIIGAGHAGLGAAKLATKFGNRVILLDVNLNALERAKYILGENTEFLISNTKNIKDSLAISDVIINCILWPKWRKDHLITRNMLKIIKKDCIIVDVSCDEAGAIETSRASSFDDPIYLEENIRHYAVDNIPSAFSKSASTILSANTLPYLIEIANKGVKNALLENSNLRNGLSFYKGKLTLRETALKQNRIYTKAEDAIIV